MSGPDEQLRAGIREAALRLLGRREHSVVELGVKLRARGWPEPEIGGVIEELADAGLQSDERFAESFVRSRARRGYGPRRIIAELAQRGIGAADAQRAIETQEIDFHALAEDFCRRKYGDAKPPADFRERARRSRALYRRGFEAEHIRGLA